MKTHPRIRGGYTARAVSLVFGLFCEVEGPEERIRALADRLGLRAEQVETRGYPQLQRLHDAGSSAAR